MALDAHKTDPNLGAEIQKLLISKGVEIPMRSEKVELGGSKIKNIESAFTRIMMELGLDLKDDSLKETPKRVAKMYINEIFWGLDYNNFPKVTVIENKMQYNQMLLETGIAVKSQCEHHFLPFIGTASVAYLPASKVIGLSKINRIVEFFSRRPQVQERLVEQIFHTLCYVLETDDVAVIIKAGHTCVKLRGVEDVNSETQTSRLGGTFLENDRLRNELYQSIKCGI